MRRRGHYRLRFCEPLEEAYREAFQHMARALRLFFGGLMLLLYLLSPLVDTWFLHPPNAVNEVARPLQFGLVVPLLLTTILCSWAPSLHRFSNAFTILALLAIAYCSMHMRLAGHAHGFEIATDWINVATLGAFFFTSMRLPIALAVGLCLLTLNIYTEVSVAGDGGLGLINLTYELESMAVIFALGLSGGYIIEVNSRLTWLEASELEQRLDFDALTGAFNRNRFRTLYRQRFQLAAREQQGVCVALIDIDHFKLYNDHYGHARGDHCLNAVGRKLNQFAAEKDGLCARLGGEEFAILFFTDSLATAREALEGARNCIRSLNLPHNARPDSETLVTVSIGGLFLIPDGRCNRFEAIRRADNALYAAKANGRNCVVLRGVNEH